MNNEQFKTDYYKILGISEKATPDEIRKAYRKLALQWHPDKHTENKKDAEEKFKTINEAYAILSDEKNKQEYDEYRKYGGTSRTKFDFSDHFGRREDPFEMFRKFFERDFRDFGCDDEDEDEDDFFSFGNFGSLGGKQMPQSKGISKTVQKTTQIINGKKITKTVTTTVDRNGEKKVEVIEESDDTKGNKSKKQISSDNFNYFNNFKNLHNFDNFDSDSDDDFGFGFAKKKKTNNKKQLR